MHWKLRKKKTKVLKNNDLKVESGRSIKEIKVQEDSSNPVSPEEREYRRNYYLKNKERIKEYKRQYYKKNKDKILAKNRAYREENFIKIAKQEKEYRKKNSEKISERKRLYYLKNREAILAKKKRKKKTVL